jgi:ADP-L-glycero-D-manno-heptose 6-epimerase
VTGAAGFIGSNLAHRLAADGHSLVLVDHDLTPAKSANLAGLPSFRFVRHDLFLTRLASGAERPDAIFHLGACSSTTETNWDYLQENNVEYTRKLWKWCAVQQRPLIYASSAATYGDGSLGFDDRTPPTDLTPLNLYGKSKNDFYFWTLAGWAADWRPPPVWAGMKFFNVYGPREAHKGRMASMVWHAYRQIVSTGEVKLFRSTHPDYADGGQERDFVFVGDCVEHMLWLWRRPHGGGVYNSGTGTARTFLDLIHATFAALGREPVVKFIDMPADLAAQYQNHTKAQLGKLRATGFAAAPTTVEAGVAEYVRWLTSPESTRRAA